MRNRWLILVGFALTLACLAFYVFEPPFVRAVSLKTYDFLMGQISEPAAPGRVAIVDIDEATLARYGQWPWPRYRVAELADKIFNAGAAVVAFDIIFPEPDRTSPYMLKNELKSKFGVDVEIAGLSDSLSDFDRILAHSLSGRNTILGCFLHPATNLLRDVDVALDPHYRGFFYKKGRGDVNATIPKANGITISIPELNAAAGNNAFINTLPDDDNVIRSTPLVWSLGESRIYPSLALEAVRMAAGVSQIGIEHDENGIALIRLREIAIPTDGAGRLTINFRRTSENGGYSRSLPWYSAEKVMSGEVDREYLGGRIVFVGTSATGLRDLRATPLAGEFPGVEIHATVVDNILSGEMLIQPRWMRTVDMAVILFAGMLLTILVTRGRSWLSFLNLLLLILLAVWGSLLLLRNRSIVFVPTWPIISMLVVYMVLTMARFWQEERQKRHVRSMFGTMVSQEVLKYLEDHPERLSLSGQKTDATMFFSDVAGFTSISENLPPEKLSELLNRYLSPMTSVIMNRRGYVDKYEGDAIMAEWGVPFPLADHAVQACLAALEQQEMLDVLRPILERQFGYAIHVRMGINSGRVTAGNMGSERRQQFTVMGDAVNQAARLEPVNKDYGTRIIIGQATYDIAKDSIETRMLDKIVVAGKTQPVCIYELIGRKGSVASGPAEFASVYEDALRLHWERRWDDAEKMLEKAARFEQGDGAVLRLKKRIAFYRQNPPPSEWVGEYVRASKD